MNSFESLNKIWETVCENFISFYQIGPFKIRISSDSEFLGRKLARAFNHLSAEKNSAPDLQIRIWSSLSLPDLNWNQIQSNGYRGYTEPPLFFHYFETIDALSAVDTEQGIAYFIVRDSNQLPWWVDGAPFQTILHVWFREKGMQLTHAASVSNGKRALLLAGKGGSGKSTTVLSCLQEGFKTLGEDYILLGKPLAFSIYQTAKWKPHTRTLFPSFERFIVNPSHADQEKALVYYQELFPSQLALRSEVFGIVSLQIGTRARLEKSDLRSSLKSLLLTTVMQLPHPDSRTSEILQTFGASVDHYRLTLSPKIFENVQLLRSLFL